MMITSNVRGSRRQPSHPIDACQPWHCLSTLEKTRHKTTQHNRAKTCPELVKLDPGPECVVAYASHAYIQRHVLLMLVSKCQG